MPMSAAHLALAKRDEALLNLAKRVLEYVGPDHHPKLECDAELRRIAKAAIKLVETGQ